MTYTYTAVQSQRRHCQARGLVEHVGTGTQESIPLSQRQRSVPRELFLLPVRGTLNLISVFSHFAGHNWKQSGKRIRGSQVDVTILQINGFGHRSLTGDTRATGRVARQGRLAETIAHRFNVHFFTVRLASFVHCRIVRRRFGRTSTRQVPIPVQDAIILTALDAAKLRAHTRHRGIVAILVQPHGYAPRLVSFGLKESSSAPTSQ